MRAQYYVEYWTLGDTTKTIEAKTFHIDTNHLVNFLRKFIKTGRYLVHLQQGQRVLFTKRAIGHRV